MQMYHYGGPWVYMRSNLPTGRSPISRQRVFETVTPSARKAQNIFTWVSNVTVTPTSPVACCVFFGSKRMEAERRLDEPLHF